MVFPWVLDNSTFQGARGSRREGWGDSAGQEPAGSAQEVLKDVVGLGQVGCEWNVWPLKRTELSMVGF